MADLTYTGNVPFDPNQYSVDGLYPYIPSPELVDAVNLTIFLKKRPLLIKGDPGAGKTRLARAVAHELSLPYFEWNIKSTTRAQEGLYTYDAVRRLQDGQLAHLDPERRLRVEQVRNYIQLGELGKAFAQPTRAVLLIDEIDKADLDFPNDLLLELDQQRFSIKELNMELKAKHPPIVFITSNDEKDLPDAFLRRCLFCYVAFPSTEQLVQIVRAHFTTAPQELVSAAVQRFVQLRRQMEQQKGSSGKKVSTSELLDWFTVLQHYPTDEALARLNGKLPFPEVLLKNWQDHMRYLQEQPVESA